MLQQENTPREVSDLAKVQSIAYGLLSILIILSELVVGIFRVFGLVTGTLFGIKTAIAVAVFLGCVALAFYAGRGGGLAEKLIDNYLNKN